MNISGKRVAFIIFTIFLVAFLFYYFGLSHYVTLESIKVNAASLKAHVNDNYALSVIGFIVASALLMSLTLPLTGPIGIFAGFLFGFWLGVIYAMIGVMLGILASFLMIRYALYRLIMHTYGERLQAFNNRMKVYGYSYLVTLQLLTIVPYFIINTLAVLAHVPFHIFVWTTFAGSLPGVALYAFAGRELTKITAWGDIISVHTLTILILLAILALMPMVMRKYQRVDKV